jgi:hypothetical protein
MLPRPGSLAYRITRASVNWMGLSQTAHGIVQGSGSDAATRWVSSMMHALHKPIPVAGAGHWVHLFVVFGIAAFIRQVRLVKLFFIWQ